jgi:hypothetical protein
MTVAGGRTRRLSVASVIAVIAMLASLLAPWSVSIPPAHVAQSFGYQTPACWFAVLAVIAAAALEVRLATVAVAVALGVILAWFAWATWIVTTPAFTQLPFSFMGTDVIGPGWYGAAIGLLFSAGAVVKALDDAQAPVGRELWLLTAIPGYGLMRLRRWGRGLAFAALVCGAIYFASTDSPDPTQFADYGLSNNVPPPIPRGPEWFLLGVAAVLWLASVGATILEKRRQGLA